MASHDHDHCNGDGCAKKDTCYRYTQLTRLKEDGIDINWVWMVHAKDCIDKDHIAHQETNQKPKE